MVPSDAAPAKRTLLPNHRMPMFMPCKPSISLKPACHVVSAGGYRCPGDEVAGVMAKSPSLRRIATTRCVGCVTHRLLHTVIRWCDHMRLRASVRRIFTLCSSRRCDGRDAGRDPCTLGAAAQGSKIGKGRRMAVQRDCLLSRLCRPLSAGRTQQSTVAQVDPVSRRIRYRSEIQRCWGAMQTVTNFAGLRLRGRVQKRPARVR
jgi:hypothetical protein